ncbi:MAG: sensor histidine kinase [Candidatus Kryptoniota bacterium]
MLTAGVLLAGGLSPQARLTQYVFNSWQVKDGLPQNSIQAICQAQDGFIWFATYEGLARFDGISFKTYDRGNTPALLSNRIVSLTEDQQGHLWIGTYGGGLTMMAAGSCDLPDSFKTFTTQDGLPNMYLLINQMVCDRDGNVWFLTEHKGISRFDGKKFEQFELSSGEINHPDLYRSLTVDSKGELWVVSGGHLWHYINSKFHLIPARSGVRGVVAVGPAFHTGVWSACLQKYGDVRLVHLDSDKVLENIDVGRVGAVVQSCLFEDQYGAVWGALSSGKLMRYYSKRIETYSTEEGLTNEFIQTLFQDKEGSLWIGTNGGGVDRMRSSPFVTIGKKEGLIDENIWALFADSHKRLWIAPIGPSLYQCNDVTNSHAPIIVKKLKVPMRNYFSATEDKEGNVFLGNSVIAKPSGELIHNKIFLNSSLLILQIDHRGTLWAGSPGQSLYKYENGVWKRFGLLDGLVGDDVRSLMVDHRNILWIGTQEGLSGFNGKLFRNYTTQDGLPNNWVRSTYEDSTGNIWIATDGGLARIRDGKIYAYTTASGLFSNTIHIILEDDSSRLWMSSNKGIFVVRKNDLYEYDAGKIQRIGCRVYEEADGMRSSEGNGSFPQGGCRTEDGRLWFATVKGVAIVNPNQFNSSKYIPPVVIEEVTADGKVISQKHDHIVTFGTRSINFKFAALAYRIPGRNKYKYRLDRFDRDWNTERHQTTATYSNLNPGRYVFRVIASNEDGVWNTQGATFDFTIPSPFYMTWWFRGIIIVISFGATGGSIRFIELRRVKRRLRQLEHEQALEHERSRISKDLHDEVGSSLTKIIILCELSKKSKGKSISSNLENVSVTAREIIDNMSQIIWAIDPKNDTLENTLSYVREYIAGTFELLSRRIAINFPLNIPPVVVSPEFRRNVFLTIKESLNNAIKYSSANQICTDASIENDRLNIRISDNGVGFDLHTMSGFGNGLKNMRSRIENIGGTLVVESRIGQGTTISFSVPIRTFV